MLNFAPVYCIRMTDISFWQFPLSLILSLASLAGLLLLWRYLPSGRVRRILCGKAMCAISIVAFLILTALEGTYGTAWHRSPAMWVASVIMMVSLGLTIMDSIKVRRSAAGILSHLGLFLLMYGAFWGAPDVVDAQMAVFHGHDESYAYTGDGRVVTLPFSVRLVDFSIDYYDDGISPRQYSSVLRIDGKEYETSVNHPCLCKGFYIYQSDYDQENGEYSVLKVVRDPWLPVVFLGMLLLAAGAVAGLERCWNSVYMFLVVAVIAVAFAVISVARINFGTLMPALRSLWFIPHLALYMLAYSSLALALITGVMSLFSKKERKSDSLSLKLLSTASALLLLGMLCGAVWAKYVWGDWWTWDAKECWAAVTWLFTLLGTHLPVKAGKKGAAVLVCILLAFLAMQVAWYGVEALPASHTSLHTYNY